MDRFASGISFRHAAGERRGIEALNAVEMMPVRFLPVDATRFDIDIEGTLAPTFHVWTTRSRSGFKTVPAVTTEVLTLRLPTAGRMRWRDRREDYVTKSGQGFLLPFETLFSFEAAPDFEALSCTIPAGVLAQSYRALGHDDMLDPHKFQPVIDIDTLPLRALSASLHRISAMMRARCDADDLTTGMLSEVFVYQLLSAWPRDDAARACSDALSSLQAIRSAREYIDAHLERPLSIAEIAGAAAISVRTLQTGFRKVFEQTPMQYVIGARLDRVYDDLQRDPQAAVAQVARRWGFVHLSDFSRRYAHRFGETPSASRRGRPKPS